MTAQTILPANSVTGGYEVSNSLRFNDGSSDNLSRSTGTPSSRQKFTFSTWIKLSSVSGNRSIFNIETDGNTTLFFMVKNGDQLHFVDYNSSAEQAKLTTNALYRDPSAWYHVVLRLDSTQGTNTNRCRLYVNGEQITSFSATAYPDQNYNFTNNVGNTRIGVSQGAANYWDGYMAETVYCDNQSLAPDQFGEFDEDSGIWKPIDVSGLTFGNNGFYLDFESSGSLGADVSGESNNFTVNNLTAIDQTTDTCTNNFMTLNPLITLTSTTDNQVYSEGNTVVIPNSTDNYGTAFGTFGATRGKWYWEAKIIWNGTENNANYPRTIGFMRDDYAFNQSTLGQNADNSWGVGFADLDTDGWGLDHNGNFTAITGATTLASTKMLMFALDLDNGKFYMGYDGTFFTSGDPTSGSTGTGAIATLDATDLSFNIIPALTNATNVTYYQMNFGNPAYAIASSNADGDGFGNFEFAVPSGYFSWCTKNLAEYG